MTGSSVGLHAYTSLCTNTCMMCSLWHYGSYHIKRGWKILSFIINLWNHLCIGGSSLTETSLCRTWLCNSVLSVSSVLFKNPQSFFFATWQKQERHPCITGHLAENTRNTPQTGNYQRGCNSSPSRWLSRSLYEVEGRSKWLTVFFASLRFRWVSIRDVTAETFQRVTCLEPSADQCPVKADADSLAGIMWILELFLTYLFPFKM